jgi:hypothetical protein
MPARWYRVTVEFMDGQAVTFANVCDYEVSRGDLRMFGPLIRIRSIPEPLIRTLTVSVAEPPAPVED